MSTWNDLPNNYSHAIAEIERLRAELNDRNEQLLATQAVNRMLVKQQHALFAALKACADDLEASIEAEYKNTLDYPLQQRRYERDMEPVRNARAAIKLAEGG